MKALRFALLAVGVLACGDGESNSDAMAEEVNGVCRYTPGEYVITHRVQQATSICRDMEPLADEYVTITNDRTLVSTSGGGGTPTNCVEGRPVVDGCYVAMNRNCLFPTSFGHLDIDVGIQMDYAAGGGQVTYEVLVYSGEFLREACTISMSRTVHRL